MTAAGRRRVRLSALTLGAAAAVSTASLSVTSPTTASLVDREVIHGSLTAGTWDGPLPGVRGLRPDAPQPDPPEQDGWPEAVAGPVVVDQPASEDGPEQPVQPELPDQPVDPAGAPPPIRPTGAPVE